MTFSEINLYTDLSILYSQVKNKFILFLCEQNTTAILNQKKHNFLGKKKTKIKHFTSVYFSVPHFIIMFSNE